MRARLALLLLVALAGLVVVSDLLRGDDQTSIEPVRIGAQPRERDERAPDRDRRAERRRDQRRPPDAEPPVSDPAAAPPSTPTPAPAVPASAPAIGGDQEVETDEAPAGGNEPVRDGSEPQPPPVATPPVPPPVEEDDLDDDDDFDDDDSLEGDD